MGHSPRSTAAGASSGTPAPRPSAPKLSNTEDSVKTLREKVDSNQQEMEKSVRSIAEEARTAQEANTQQFADIRAALAQIMACLPTAATDTTSNNQAALTNERGSVYTDTEGLQMPCLTPQSLGAASIVSARRSHHAGSTRATTYKLHDLPQFSGEPEEWPKFQALYMQTTDAYDYSSLDNNIRLQRALCGPAKEVVDYLLLDTNGSEAVMKALEFRFGRPELLAQSQLRRVRQIPPIMDYQPERVIDLAAKVANMVAFLSRPKCTQYLANPELMQELVAKLPASNQHEWSRHAINIEPYPTLQQFSEWLQELARCVSFRTPGAVLALTQPSTNRQNAEPRQPRNNVRRNHAFQATSAVQQCAVCETSNHSATNCRRYAAMDVNERWNVARSKRLCFACLRSGHGTAQCSDRSRCGIDGCQRPHHQLLHQAGARHTSRHANDNERPPDAARGSANRAETNGGGASSQDDDQSGNVAVQRVHNCQQRVTIEPNILSKVLPVRLFNAGRVVHTFAFLDDGSTVTMLDEAVADELGLGGPTTDLPLQMLRGQTTTEQARTVTLTISGSSSGHNKYAMTNVRTIQQLDLPLQSVRMSQIAAHGMRQLRGLPIENYTNAVPKLLIGSDNAHLIVAMRQISCENAGLVAMKTRLGWCVYGPSAGEDARSSRTVMHLREATHNDTALEELQTTVSNYFGLENFGVRHVNGPLESRSDKRARDIMARTTARKDGRYETGLLWRDDLVEFPDSRPMAKKRLMSVERKMLHDAAYADKYREIIRGYLAKGYARRLSSEEADLVDGRIWYLPHFAVVNPNKPDKMRVVFDAAAVAHGISLNSKLLKGPDLNRPLVAVLHQFRMGAVGVCADIQEMFLQVRIRADDVNSQRFLWRDGDASKPIEEYVMCSMIFGAACSPSSAQFVKNSNARGFEQAHPAAVRAIVDGHYVDDFVYSFDAAEDAIRVTRDVVDIHRHGGFNLRSFVSNSPEVLSALGSDAASPTAMDMQLDTAAEKILGMYWCTAEDAFCFRLQFNRVDPMVIAGKRRPTKREMLSATMSVYDPFGVLAHFTIYAKLMLQELWRLGTGWDEPITPDLDQKWQQWLAKLECCRQVRVPRWYGRGITTSRVELHVFVDASQTAYAAVAYWRIEVAPGQWSVSFVAGKSRCAPPKLLSVPRLELQAAILGVRLCSSIKATHSHALAGTYFWTDSRTVVQWIRADRVQFRPFVAHRIAEILEETTVADWRWLPTAHNAADDATRAKYPVRFVADSRWLRGPDFLLQAELQWPAEEEPADTPCDVGTDEVRPRSVHLVCSKPTIPIVQLIRFGDFHRCCRAMAVALRFIHNVRTKTKKTGGLQPQEIAEAERHLIRAVQAEAFAEEVASLKQTKAVDKGSQLRALLPHIDADGIIRATGRVDKAMYMPEDARNPIVLPKEHHLTFILVATYHRRLRHQQQAAVVSEIRQKYWVPHLRTIVRRVKSQCTFCRIKAARPAEPVMGQLPRDRLTPFVRPFTYTGVDFFGPMFVSVGRRREKRWVAIFTCMTIRAIHLELAADLSTDACIICLRNFVNIRGVPKVIRSDNGKNFVGASRELKAAVDLFDHAAIERELGTRNIEWRFNCPANPEAGGCWERLIQCVKRVLMVTMTETAPRVETLRSLLIEAANIVNARPLTHVPVSNDDDEPLTPNHFLLGTSSSTQTPGADDERLVCMRKQWRIANALKDRFWKRWMLEYLPDLTRRAKGYDERPQLQIGSLVLICDPNLPRGKWRRGRITETFPGSDGRIRTAMVATSDGVLHRPVTKLAVLNVE